jgi:hypothetical protein
LGFEAEVTRVSNRTACCGDTHNSNKIYPEFPTYAHARPFHSGHESFETLLPLLMLGSLGAASHAAAAAPFKFVRVMTGDVTDVPTLAIRISEVLVGRRIVVEAQTIPGRNYRLESSSDLKKLDRRGANRRRGSGDYDLGVSNRESSALPPSGRTTP